MKIKKLNIKKLSILITLYVILLCTSCEPNLIATIPSRPITDTTLIIVDSCKIDTTRFVYN